MGSRSHYWENVQKYNGDALVGATVNVYQQGTTTPIVETIYQYDSDHASQATTLSNPLSTDSAGKVEFYLASPKRVDLKISKAGYVTVTKTVDVTKTPNDGAPGASGAIAGLREAGTNKTVRGYINFLAGFDLTDDSGNDETEVEIDLSELSHNDLGGLTTGNPHTQYSQTSHTHDSTYILNTLAAAKGDIFAASANDTPAIRSVGTNRQALVADSSQSTGLAWRDPIPVNALLWVGVGTWTNMPSSATELFGVSHVRTKLVLTDAAQVRIVVRVSTAGASGAILYAEYSTDGSSWAAMDGASGPSVAIDAIGQFASSFVNLTALAKADVHIRIMGSGGDGAADPVIGTVALQAK